MDNYLELALNQHGLRLETWLTEEKTEETDADEKTDQILKLAASLFEHDLEKKIQIVTEKV